MIEQSLENGPLYVSTTSEKSIASKKAIIAEITFGPYHELIIYKAGNGFMVWDTTENQSFMWPQGTQPVENPKELMSCKFGKAKYENEEHLYYVQNTPKITEDFEIPFNQFEIPSSLTGYPYDRTFQYTEKLSQIIGHLPATYVDRYKRPINVKALRNHRYLPTSIDKVTTTYNDLEHSGFHFPIVCDLRNTDLAIIDLEPGYTEQEKIEAEKIPYLYKEETPRGGIHYLIKTDSNAYKYRISENLEIIVNTMVTFYGINGQVSPNEFIISKDYFNQYQEVGHKSHTVQETDKNIVELVDALEAIQTKQFKISNHQQAVNNIIATDKDDSHADYMILRYIYKSCIQPYEQSLKQNDITDEDYPWIMAEFFNRLAPFRLKHNSERTGIPYLVYVAKSVVTTIKS